MQLEADFFAGQPFDPPPRALALLVVDFDDTCTCEDTTAAIARTAIAAAARRAGPAGSAAGAAARAGLEGRLQALVKNYLDSRATLLEEILPPAVRRLGCPPTPLQLQLPSRHLAP
jgi:hydroxymethylpyrimidine kinase/phosphomethylpyrimidine kinase/thiamine-phosphate diphosphorylase